MNYPPSAVSIARLPQSYVADNSQAITNIGRAIGTVKSQNIQDQLLNGSEEVKTPEQQKAELQSQAIDLKEQDQLISAKQQANEERRVVRENTRLTQIMNSPEDKKALLKLQQLDPQAAKSTLDILKADDAAAKQQYALAAQDSMQFFGNYKNMLLAHGKEAADQLALEKAQSIYAETGDPASVNHLMALRQSDPDKAAALADRQYILAGGVLKVPEVQEAVTLADGAQLRNPVTGELIAENEKDQTSTINAKNSNQIRREQLAFDKEKHRAQQSKLSPRFETALLESQQAAQDSASQAAQLETLSQEFSRLDDSGAEVSIKEKLKAISGSEDYDTLLRKRYLSLRNSQAVKNLPPGVASDKDIALVLSGYLPETANSEVVSEFLSGMAKLERKNQQFNEFRAEYIDQNRTTRGMLKSWKDSMQEQAEADPLGLR